jgi:DNA-binding CsgD family transcriptional regulator/tetratricopeptide (TPR) repeat protein
MLTVRTELDPDELLRITGGIPFFVSELAKDPGGVPKSITASVTSRLQSLPAGIRGALEILSVMPRPARLSLLTRLVPDAELLAAGDARGLWTLEGEHVQFRHELTRQAILDSLPETTRHRYHDAILTELLRDESDPAAVLHHAVMANRGEVVVRYGLSAAREAYRAGAHREAVQHQQHVLRYRDLVDPTACAQLLEEHAWSLYHLHRFPLAVEAARGAVSLRRQAASPEPYARALCILSRMEYLHNDPVSALGTAEEAVTVAEETGNPEVHAEARLARASLLSLLDRRAEARPEVAAVLAAAQDLGRTDLESLALNYLATCGPVEGEPAELTTQWFIQAVTVAREAGHLEAAARAYTNLVSELVWRYHPDLDRWYDEAIAFTSDHDFPSFRYNIIGQGSRHLIGQGRWQEAEAALRDLLGVVQGVGVLEIVALEGLARLLVRRGDPDADSVLARAWELAVDSKAAQYTGPVGVIRAERAYLLGDTDEAARVHADVPIGELEPVTRGELLVYLRRAGVDVDEAHEVAAPWASVLAGDHAAAAREWAAIGNPYEQALALLATDEESSLLEAVDILDRLEAAPAARLVRRRLRELGVRAIPRGPAASTRSNPAGLTQRQLEVLGLVADGMTNAQIADHLVVSVRTVDHHVSAVLQKLGVSSRQEAVSALREDDPTPA